MKQVSWWQRWTLMPYGRQLCAPDTMKWLFGVGCFVVIVAVFDGLVWGYAGSSYGTTRAARIVLGAGLGVLIALGVAIADSWLMTFDRSYGVYDGHERTWRDVAKSHATFILRIAIVACTVVSVRPFLPRLLYKNSVTATINQKNDDEITKARAAVQERWVARINDLREEDRKLAEADVKEVSGQGASKKYGTGKVHRLLLDQRDQIQAQITAASSAMTKELGQFNRLSHEDLTRTYGVVFLEDDPATRAKVLADLRRSSTAQDESLALFEGLIAFFICVLLIAKVAQPHSVLIYYSAQLQSLYEQYLRGTFNQWIEPEERPVNGEGRMTAHRFAEWVLNTYLPKVRDINLRMKHGMMLSEYHIRLDSLTQVERDAVKDLQLLEVARDRAEAQAEQSAASLSKHELTEQLLEVRLQDLRARQKDVSQAAGRVGPDAADVALKRIDEMAAEIRKTESEIDQLRVEIGTATTIRQRRDEERDKAVTLVEAKNAELSALRDEIATVRLAVVAAIDKEMPRRKMRPHIPSATWNKSSARPPSFTN